MAASMSSCPLCGGRSFQPLLTKRSDAGDVRLERCRACGLTLQEGRTQAFAADLYAYYARLATAGPEELFPALNDKCQAGILASFAKAPGRRLLDVGCGLGQFVRTATALGWDAKGIDLARDAVAIAKRHGVRCDVTDFFSSELDGERLDVVTMFEFIEHIADPVRFFERTGHLLNPGGLLYLTTPNFSSLDQKALGARWRVIHPEHLLYFTPRTLRRAVEQVGMFDVKAVWAHNMSLAALWARLRQALDLGSGSRGPPDETGQDQTLRAAIEERAVARLAKRSANFLLSQLGLGSTLKLLATRR